MAHQQSLYNPANGAKNPGYQAPNTGDPPLPTNEGINKIGGKTRKQFRFGISDDIELLKEVNVLLPFLASHGQVMSKWISVATNCNEKYDGERAQKRFYCLIKTFKSEQRSNLKKYSLNMGCAEWVNGPATANFSGRTWDVVKMMLAEFMGTFILCFLGISSCLKWYETDVVNPVRIAFGFGLTITGVIYMMGPISGAHINPAITVASMISGRINASKGIFYIFFQCLGAIAGSGTIWLLHVDSEVTPANFGLTLPNPRMSSAQALFAEVILTMIFVMVFLSVTDQNWSYVKGSASLAIGFTATACILGHASSTGTSLNPARSLGPAVIMAHIDYLWIYWVGPLTGAALAAFLYKVLIYIPKEPEIQLLPVDEVTATSQGYLSNFEINNDALFEEVVIDDGPDPIPTKY